ncbi:MAG: hypothetical protein M1587_07665 [Thaumarchaeota archaeon]|nr:hypothetical protein [Nitrososphaerota archaeon]
MADKNILKHTEVDMIKWFADLPNSFVDELEPILYPPDQYGHLELAVYQGLHYTSLNLSEKGEIDLLVFPLNCPENATALQVKQTKFLRDVKGREYFEKNIRKKVKAGIEQSMRDWRTGFWQTFFLLFIEYDGQSNYHGFGAPPPSMFDSIETIVRKTTASLEGNECIGLSVLTVSQISPKSIDFTGGISPKHIRAPMKQPQPSLLTDSLRKLPKVERHYCNVPGCLQTFLKIG